jgi:hypothetical protein
LRFFAVNEPLHREERKEREEPRADQAKSLACPRYCDRLSNDPRALALRLEDLCGLSPFFALLRGNKTLHREERKEREEPRADRAKSLACPGYCDRLSNDPRALALRLADLLRLAPFFALRGNKTASPRRAKSAKNREQIEKSPAEPGFASRGLSYRLPRY